MNSLQSLLHIEVLLLHQLLLFIMLQLNLMAL